MAYKVTALPPVQFTSSAATATNAWTNIDDASSITIYLSTQFPSTGAGGTGITYTIQGSPMESTVGNNATVYPFFSTGLQIASTQTNDWYSMENVSSTALYTVNPGQAVTVTGISMLRLRIITTSSSGGASSGDATGASVYATKQISV